MLPQSPRPRLVIFDCDGVLVNSEPIFNRVLHKFLLSVGADLSFEECCTVFTGKSKGDVEAYLRGQKLVFPTDWAKAFYRDALEALHDEVEPISGASQAVQTLLDSGVACCVASNGLMRKMRVTLDRTGMLSWFEGKMYSAYDIGASKPAPDVFLHAARVNNVLPEDCLVVEDSASGFQAASNASMRCLAYTPHGTQHLVDLFEAQPFAEMRQLPSLIGID